MANHRCRKVKIHRIQNVERIWVTSQEDIMSEGVRFDQQQFKGSSDNFDFELVHRLIPSLVSEYMNQILVQMSSEEEIFDVIKDLNADSASGPDGFGGLFYQNCWSIIKANFVKAVHSFFYGSSLPKSWTSTFFVTIPKVKNSKNFGEFKPISLCNFNVNVILKILTNRLAPFIL